MPTISRKLRRETLDGRNAVAILAALAQTTRLQAFCLLRRYYPFGLAVGDIVRLLAVPQNTLSTHLSLLQHAGLIRSRREGRSVIYAVDPSCTDALFDYLSQGSDLAQRRSRPRGQHSSSYPVKRGADAGAGRIYNVLVLCTGNSARSILAEAIINREGAGRFRAYSAGSHPKGKPNAYGIELLKTLGYDVSAVRSKSWTEFAKPGAPKMDFVITVCDSAAGEQCPYWPGHPLVAHWGIPDPVEVPGTPDQKRAAFHETYRQLMNRTTTFVNLPIEALDLAALKARLNDIGKMEGATEMTVSRLSA